MFRNVQHIYHVYTSGCYTVAIDNHNSKYLGMAVQLYVQAHLGHYP